MLIHNEGLMGFKQVDMYTAGRERETTENLQVGLRPERGS